MRLRLTIRPPGDGEPSTDVTVELDPETPARTLLAALAEAVGRPAGDVGSAVVERSGTRLTGDGGVGSLDLVDGDCLHLERHGEGSTVIRQPGQTAATETDSTVDLVVVGGPLMGTRIGLAGGRHVVGRGPGADVVLADRSLSRRHLEVTVGAAGVSVADLGSSNGTYLDGVALDGPRELPDGQTVEAGRTLIAFESGSAPPAQRRADGNGGVAFNRPPRVAAALPAARHTVPGPPAADRGPTLPLGAALIPVVLAAAMYALTGSAAVLMIGALGPAMALWNFSEQRRRSGREGREQLTRFEQEMVATIEAVERERSEEASLLRAGHPDAASALRVVAELGPRLWERRPADPDFLELRVGVADRRSGVTAEVQASGDRERRETAQARLDQSAVLPSVPVAAPAAGLGLIGNRSRAVALARWLVAQVAVHHSPAEASLAAALPGGAAAGWDWLKWLPHLRAEDVAVGEPAARDLLERLAATGSPHTVLLVDGDLHLDRGLVADVLGAGTAVVWLGRTARDLPGGITTIADVDAEIARLRLTRVQTGEVIDDVVADGVTGDWAEQVARLLAAVRDAAGRSEGEALPASVSLLDLLGLPDPTAAAIEQSWSGSGPDLAAPLGVAAGGPFEIDPGRTDGLRALIAGMPGAGKSELLQSLVAALAARHPPNRLAFLLVDYKGGAAFGDCVDLPHTAGLVTDLDGQLAERARVSLLAELRRREARLAEAGARSLRELAARDPQGAPPAMIIVVDEFATLVREVPAFVDTMVDVAQRGRSLGLHLVLATQRPRGAVSDTIRANTNLRIAMRAADAGESQDVIEAPDAAAIPASLPGRAIALTGRRSDGRPELTHFQAAYASGRAERLGHGAVSVAEFTLAGADDAPARQLSIVGRPGPTDLQAIAEAARAAADRLGLVPPEPPWLPPLPACIDLADLPEPAAPGIAVLGLLDDPGRRAQEPLTIDLDRDGSALVFGGTGAGKTTALRTLAAGLARRHGPRELHLYALDYASRGLRALEVLPQCGAVIGAEDEERAIRLLERLERLADDRRRLLGERGAASVAELAARGEPVPRVVLLLDGYPAFAAAFERVRFGRDVATVQRLAGDGRPLGIHVVLTADRRAGVPGGLAGVVAARIVLRMADDDDYPALGISRAAVAGAELPPGRGFTSDGRLAQLAVLGGDAAAEREALDALGSAVAARHPGERAPGIRTLPERVEAARLPAAVEPLTAVVGIGNDRLEPVVADLRDDHFLVAGALRSGRSTALGTLVASLRRATPDAELHLLAPRRSPLLDLDGWASAARGVDECRAAAERLTTLLDRPSGSPAAVVVVDDGAELSELAALEPLTKRGRDQAIRILAAVETHAAQRAYGGWLRELRAGRSGLLLQPDVETDGELLGVKLPRGTGALGSGRGYLVQAGTAELVQVGL